MRPIRKTDARYLAGRLVAILGGMACLLLWIGLLKAEPAGAQVFSGIISPRDNAVVAGSVAIQGTATHPDFWKYELYYSQMAVEEWVFIGQIHETPTINGQLEIWHTNSVPDGAYRLRLRVVRRDGNYDEYFVRNVSVSNTLPTVTPTLEITPTSAFTPTPLPPTPTILVEQPQLPTATAQPTMAEVAALETQVTPEADDVVPPASPPSAFSLEGLSNAACYGGASAGGIFLLVVILALLRRLVSLLLSRL